jgi:hypothetical protein
MSSPGKRPITRADSETSASGLESSPRKQRRVVLSCDDDKLPASHAPSSQSSTLPNEIGFQILKDIPVANLLDFRLLNSSYRNEIDTHIFYHHLQDAELIGYLGPKVGFDRLLERLSDEDHLAYTFVRAHFYQLDPPAEGQPKWTPRTAYFRVNPGWYETLKRIGGRVEWGDAYFNHMGNCLNLHEAPDVYGQLRWAIRVGGCVLDLGLEKHLQPKVYQIDPCFEEGVVITITDWKMVLQNFFREERALERLIREKEGSEFTFGHHEDCLRALRRWRYRSNLDLDDELAWQIDNMRALFGRAIHRPMHLNLSDTDYADAIAIIPMMEHTEDDAIRTLLMLRREASMNQKERKRLQTIVAERTEMIEEMNEFEHQFKTWQEYTLAVPTFSLERLQIERIFDPNPLTWSKQVIARETDILDRWKRQREALKHFRSFIAATNEIQA